jgi:hypothetical protein
MHGGVLVHMADFWEDQHFDFDDPINAEIWSKSPVVGARLVAANPRADAAGWQDRWASPPLPWVPDLVGQRWQDPGAVIVIGSTYAPFVGDHAGRRAAMSLSSYADSKSAGEFGRRFLASVVRPDAAYYQGIRELLDGIVEAERVILTDFCRASFVEQRGDGFYGGDEVVRRHSAQFHRWVDAGTYWTVRRIHESGAHVIVLLGDLAWTTFQRVASSARGTATNRDRRQWLEAGSAIGGSELVLGDVKRFAIRVAHPSWRNKNDISYTEGRRVLAKLLGVSGPAILGASTVGDAPESWVSEPRAQSARRNSGPRVVGLHFVCRGALNVRDLPDGTFESGVWVVADQHARTAEYIALHESRSMPSYRQGRILGYRRVVHEGRTRLIFHVQPGPKTLPWVGEGSGEKGYCYR